MADLYRSEGGIEFKLEGFKELMDQLDTFCSPRIQQKLVQNAVREAAKPVKAQAEANLGKGPGWIVVGTPKKRGWGIGAIAAIGVGYAKKHWEQVFTEYGTKRRVHGSHTHGKIEAKPAVVPALAHKKSEAIDRMGKYLELALKAIIEHKNKDIPSV
jgi:hypothetical protein